MPTGIVYQMNFRDVRDGLYKVDIHDTTTEADTTQVLQMTPARSPLNLSTIDNEEDKFTTIRSQQLTITFLSDPGIALAQFADGPDDRFLVEAFYNGEIMFRGFLSLSDNKEAFLEGRNEVTLTATDKLGALKDIALVDADGKNPQGKFRLIEILAMALRLTGQELNINVIHNLKVGGGSIDLNAAFINGSNVIATTQTNFFYIGQKIQVTNSTSNNGIYTVTGTETIGSLFVSVAEALTAEGVNPVTFTDLRGDDHIYDQCYLDIKTFEEEIGESEDAYTVIQKILGYDCTLFYWRGSWWIVRTNERENNVQRWATYGPDGVFNGFIEGSFNLQVGVNETNYFAQAATEWHPTREIGEVKLTLEYDYPQELICNEDFSRGEAITPFTGNGVEEVKYTPECIEYLREAGPSQFATWDQPKHADAEGVLIKGFTGGLETNRYLFGNIGGGFRHYFKFQPLEVGRNDKVTIDFNFRTSNPSITNIYPAVVIVEGNDGSIWEWNYDQPTGASFWVLKSPTDSPFFDMFHADITGLDAQSWQSISASSAPIPVDGLLYLRLVSANASYNTDFADLDFSFKPFINGSYPDFTAQSNIIKRETGGYLSRIDEDVFIGDAPIKAMKGAIYTLNDLGRFDLINVFNEGGRVNRFGWFQVQAVWNQYRNAVRVFEYDIITEDPANMPHLLHRYEITEATSSTLNRYFIMITFEMDLRQCELTGNMPEVYRIDLGKVFTDPFTFKYVTK